MKLHRSEANLEGFLVAADPPDPPLFLEPDVFSFSVRIRLLKVAFSNANGAKVTNYKIQRCRNDKPDECVVYTSLVDHFIDKGNSFEFLDSESSDIPLLASTGYTYKISAYNKAGWSTETPKQVTTSKDVPSHARVCSVGDLKNTLNGQHKYDSVVFWKTPQYANGWSVEGYRIHVYSVASNNGGCSQVSQTVHIDTYQELDAVTKSDDDSGFDYEYNIFDLLPGKIFCISITAKNKLGYSLQTSASSVLFRTGEAPPDPVCNISDLRSSLTARARRTQLKFRFQSPYNNLADITNYTVSMRSKPSESFRLVKSYNDGEKDNIISHVVSGSQLMLYGSTSYEIDVRSRNAKGLSLCCGHPNCTYTQIMTDPADIPDTVTNVKVLDVWGTGFNASLIEPYDGDAAIQEYTFEVQKVSCTVDCTTAAVKKRDADEYVEGGLANFSMDNLRANTNYSLEIWAKNKVGRSAGSQASSFVTGDPENPSAVYNFTNASIGRSKVALSWEYPSNDGGSDIISYKVKILDQEANNEIVNGNIVVDATKNIISTDNEISATYVQGKYMWEYMSLQGSTQYVATVLACNRLHCKPSSEVDTVRFTTSPPCDEGEYMSGSSEEICLSCSPGFYNDKPSVSLSCEACQKGKFQEQSGSASCTACPAGKSTNELHSQQVCASCLEGKFAPKAGMATCNDCAAGKFYDAAFKGTTCSLCPENTYNSITAAENQEKCLRCPLNMKTYLDGRTKRSNCLCISNYYADAPQGDEENDPWVPCKRCPKGAVCLSDKHGHIIDADVGYWTPPNGTLTHPEERFYKCPLDGCLGGDHKVGGAYARCAPGYKGVVCALCAEGRFKKGHKCETCEASTILPFIVLVAGFVIGCTVAVYLFRKLVHSKRMRKYSLIWHDIHRLMKIMISFAQILEGTNAVYSGVEWPPLFTAFWRLLNIAGLDFVSLSGISCAAKVDFYLSFIGQMCIPIFVIIYLGIFYFIRSSHIHLSERVALMGKKTMKQRMQLKIKTGMKIEKVSSNQDSDSCTKRLTQIYLATGNVFTMDFRDFVPYSYTHLEKVDAVQ